MGRKISFKGQVAIDGDRVGCEQGRVLRSLCFVWEAHKMNINRPVMFRQNQTAANSGREKAQVKRPLPSYEQTLDMTKIDFSQFDNSMQSAAEYYFQHAKKLYEANCALLEEVNTLAKEKLDLSNQLKTYEALAAAKTQNESGGQNEEKKRRKRRSAKEIQRLYRCKAERCDKSYGSEGTLSQHYKIKHPELYVKLFGDLQGKVQQESKELDAIQEYNQEGEQQSKSEARNP